MMYRQIEEGTVLKMDVCTHMWALVPGIILTTHVLYS
jgi:hypothetical protein